MDVHPRAATMVLLVSTKAIPSAAEAIPWMHSPANHQRWKRVSGHWKKVSFAVAL